MRRRSFQLARDQGIYAGLYRSLRFLLCDLCPQIIVTLTSPKITLYSSLFLRTVALSDNRLWLLGWLLN